MNHDVKYMSIKVSDNFDLRKLEGTEAAIIKSIV